MLTHLKSLTFLTYFTVHYNHQQMSRDWERPAGGVVPSTHQDNAKSDWGMCPVVTVMVITVWVMSAWPGLPSVRLGPGQSAGVSQDRHNTTVCCTLLTAPRVWRNPQTWRMISSRNSIEYWELCYVVTRGEEPDSGAGLVMFTFTLSGDGVRHSSHFIQTYTLHPPSQHYIFL